jgi:hypothetical protein
MNRDKLFTGLIADGLLAACSGGDINATPTTVEIRREDPALGRSVTVFEEDPGTFFGASMSCGF